MLFQNLIVIRIRTYFGVVDVFGDHLLKRYYRHDVTPDYRDH